MSLLKRTAGWDLSSNQAIALFHLAYPVALMVVSSMRGELPELVGQYRNFRKKGCLV